MKVGRLPPTNPPLCIESVARARPKSWRKSQKRFLCCMQCFAAKAEYQRHQAGLPPVHALSSGLALISLSCDFLGKCRRLIGLGGRSCFFLPIAINHVWFWFVCVFFLLMAWIFSLWHGSRLLLIVWFSWDIYQANMPEHDLYKSIVARSTNNKSKTFSYVASFTSLYFLLFTSTSHETFISSILASSCM